MRKPPATEKPTLIFFTAAGDGHSRRAEAFLAQVLQRRHNHETFKLHQVVREQRPDIFQRFAVEETPTILVADGKRVRGRLAKPRGCSQIHAFLAPWLR
jgi:thioredoxin-like negative regulator of GroEL